MKIKRDSWHYKLNCKFNGEWRMEQIRSLCPYFWTTVLHLALITLFSGLVATVVTILIIPLIHYFLIELTNENALDLVDVGVTCYILVAVIVSFLCMCLTVNKGVTTIKNKIDKIPRKKTEPNLFFEYLKAKKEKICPVIEFE